VHLATLLNIDKNEKCRITFNEITKNAVKNAIKSPREINMDLVDANRQEGYWTGLWDTR